MDERTKLLFDAGFHFFKLLRTTDDKWFAPVYVSAVEFAANNPEQLKEVIRVREINAVESLALKEGQENGSH